MTHVLVVDDDPVIAALVSFRLGELGLDVSTADDGAAGLAAVRESRPDLVVLDRSMPVMDGLAVLRALRADADVQVAGTPVLMLTAHDRPEDVAAALAAGATGHLPKPFTTAELHGRVTAALP